MKTINPIHSYGLVHSSIFYNNTWLIKHWLLLFYLILDRFLFLKQTRRNSIVTSAIHFVDTYGYGCIVRTVS